MKTRSLPRLLVFGHAFVSAIIQFVLGSVQRIQVTKWFTRKAWLNIHLLMALSVGLIFAILGFTGSICVYREELDALLNPHLMVEATQADYLSLDQIMASVRAAHPDRYGEWTLEMPRSANGMMTAWFEKPRETYFERYAPLMVSVNPYTGEVVASRFWGQTLTTWLLDLHTQLQFDQVGWNIVGFCGLLLMLSIFSGLYLWWPGLLNIRSALSIHLRMGLMRMIFDLHRMIGLFCASALLVLAFTGFHLSFPSILENIIGTSGMTHGTTGRTISSTAIPNDHPTLLEAAEFIARGPFPHAKVRRVTTPNGDTGVYRVNLRQKGEVNQRHPYTTVWVDRWSGHIKEVRNPEAFSVGENFMTWIWPLHTGEALGGFGRFCWFLAGQGLFFLYLSGVLRWLHRKGKVRDRAVSFVGLSNVQLELKNLGYRVLLTIDNYMNILAQKAIPAISRRVVMLSKWLMRGFERYQSKAK